MKPPPRPHLMMKFSSTKRFVGWELNARADTVLRDAAVLMVWDILAKLRGSAQPTFDHGTEYTLYVMLEELAPPVPSGQTILPLKDRDPIDPPPSHIDWTPLKRKCECGAEAAGTGGKHSKWCPLA